MYTMFSAMDANQNWSLWSNSIGRLMLPLEFFRSPFELLVSSIFFVLRCTNTQPAWIEFAPCRRSDSETWQYDNAFEWLLKSQSRNDSPDERRTDFPLPFRSFILS